MILIMDKIDISLTKMMKTLETKILKMSIFFQMCDRPKNLQLINPGVAAINNSDLHHQKFHRKLTLMSLRLMHLMIYLESLEVRKKSFTFSLEESQLLNS